MYKEFENPLPSKFGRMYVSNDAKLNMGPPTQGDTVTIRVSEDTDFYIQVESLNNGNVQGEIVGIGPNPAFEFRGWEHGQKIQVQESAVTAIIRAS